MRIALGKTDTAGRGQTARRAVLALLCAAAAVNLGACASVSDNMAQKMEALPGVGLPANAPARPTTPQVYPAVLEMPPARSNTVLNDGEQQKMEDELVAARSRQQELAGGPTAYSATEAKKKKAAKASAASGTAPASSNKSIY